MSTRDPGDSQEELLQASKEMAKLTTADEVREWWKKHYMTLGHRNLGRLFIGGNVERLLERLVRGTSE